MSRLTSQLFSESSSLPFLKMGATFAFSSHQKPPQMIESGSTVTPASSLNTFDASHLVPWTYLNDPQLSSLAVGSISFPGFCHQAQKLGCLGANCASRTKVTKALSTLTFYTSFSSRLLAPFNNGPTLSWVILWC